jgi:uncharacterized protein
MAIPAKETENMRPSEALAKHHAEVLEIIAKYPVSNPRVFGSVARGEDVEGSDIDIIIHPHSELTYFDVGRMTFELEALLNCKVDVGEDDVIGDHAKSSILSDARAI